MRDAGFSRQRYWGEPFPIIWTDGIALPLDAEELPLELPFVEKYGPGPDGEGPLANIKEWTSSPSLLRKMEKEAGEKEAILGERYAPKYNVGTPLQYEFAKQMRKDYTEAEDILWQQLRANKLGVKFRRQHPIEAYIADFVCLHSALIIEADGGYHETAEQKIYDEERTRVLNEIGFTVIRFTNDEVLQQTENVLGKIQNELSTIESENKKKNNRLQSHTNEEQFKGNELSHPSPRSGEGQGVRETSTMPGYAGSSWYFLRYMDPHNSETFCDRKASDYWNQVDLYIGGTEHAVGHLLYSRMWTKVLFDLGLIGFDEPFKKLLNQGMITGSSRLIIRYTLLLKEEEKQKYKELNLYISQGIFFNFFNNASATEQFQKIENDYLIKIFPHDKYKVDTNLPSVLHVPVQYVDGLELNTEEFRKWKSEYNSAILICEDGSLDIPFSEIKIQSSKFICDSNVEKMSKRYFNTVDPVDLSEKYGADTFRMYEMFLGPVEQSKPWDTKGIEGVHRFLRKLWRLFNDDLKGKMWTNEKPTDAELKILHRTIKKIEEDTEKFSFNTAVSAFMIAVNDLAEIKCYKKEILEPLLILLAPYAPHITEELYQQIKSSQVSTTGGVTEIASILDAAYPVFYPALLVESNKEYPVSINGKVRTSINLALDLEQAAVEKLVIENETVQKWLEGKTPQKIIYVKNKMINVVIK